MRYAKTETTNILVNYPSGGSITIDVYRLSDNVQVVTAAAMSSISTTGIYKYTLNQTVASKEEYLWISTDGTLTRSGKVVISGYMDDIQADLDNPSQYQTDITGLTASHVATLAAIAALNDFDPTADPVANVTLVGTTTANTDMRGTDGANTTAPDNAGIAAIPTNPLLTTDTRLNNLDAAITSRGATGEYDVRMIALQADLDNPTQYMADLSSLSLEATSQSILTKANTLTNYDDTALTALINGIKTKTDQFTFTGVNVNSIAQVVSDKTGYALTAAERTAIAVAVEQAIINDADGQAVLNAIVGAIGNQNVDEVALVAAVRADLERAGGKIDLIPTTDSVADLTGVQNSINNLNDFDPSADTVAHVTLVDTTTTNTDMRGNDIAPDNAGIAAIPINPVLTTDARLNNLDATISSRAVTGEYDVRMLAMQNDLDNPNQYKADITGLNDIGIADIQTALTNQGYTVGRASNLDNMDVVVSSRGATGEYDARFVTVQADLDDVSQYKADLTPVLTAIGNLNDLAIAEIQTALTNQGLTAARALLLDHLDKDISAVEGLSEVNLHLALDSYVNKSDYKDGPISIADKDDIASKSVQALKVEVF